MLIINRTDKIYVNKSIILGRLSRLEDYRYVFEAFFAIVITTFYTPIPMNYYRL